MARSITLMGQCMINKAAIETNKYISKCLKENEIVDRRTYSDTDSVNFATQIYVNNDKIAIGDFYESSEGKETELPNGKFVKELPDGKYNTLTVDENDFTKANETGIRYVMKHKTTKDLYKVKFKGKEITITADHSLMFVHDGKLIKGSVKDIQTGDKLIAIC